MTIGESKLPSRVERKARGLDERSAAEENLRAERGRNRKRRGSTNCVVIDVSWLCVAGESHRALGTGRETRREIEQSRPHRKTMMQRL